MNVPRFFNTAGPVDCARHYCLPPLERLDLEDVLLLIAQQKYFILHAPRQTGKTTYLLALMEYLNQQGQVKALYVNVEGAQAARENIEAAIQAVLAEIVSQARTLIQDTFPEEVWLEVRREYGPLASFGELLTQWATASELPLVLFIDEIDSLVGDTLIAVLRQLRAGYAKRPRFFPASVILCGVRDVRDYRLRTDDGKAAITGGSAFNIKAKSLRMGNFTHQETQALLHQHTEETGQLFAPDAVDAIFSLTRGQPWLVNALAYEVCFEMKAGRDRAVAISAKLVMQAKERLIERWETHLDQLADKLREPRVRRVIAPLLSDDRTPEQIPSDDVEYVRDLGLISTESGQLQIANPIYQEVIPRQLTYTTQILIPHETQWYVGEDGRLEVTKLLAAFQEFFRQHAEHWVERFEYREAGPQLLLQAFLQRVVNSGGRMEREYGLGRGRTDLLLLWPVEQAGEQQTQRAVVECKILRGSLEATVEAGLAQTWGYMDRCGAEEGHLIVFDRRPERTWEEKIFQRTETYNDTPIQVWGM